jgi:hypothetical protein
MEMKVTQAWAWAVSGAVVGSMAKPGRLSQEMLGQLGSAHWADFSIAGRSLCNRSRTEWLRPAGKEKGGKEEDWAD